MLIETYSSYWVNSSLVQGYDIEKLASEGDFTRINAIIEGWGTLCTVAIFDTRELAAAGMRRLARLLSEPGRALIMQEDIHRHGTDVFSGGNWIGRALMACVRNNGGELHLSAEEMTWLPSDGAVQAEHKEDGGLSLAWDATEAGLERQNSRREAQKASQPTAESCFVSLRETDSMLRDMRKRFVPGPDAPPLKYRLGWLNSRNEQVYDIPEMDADYDTVKDREKWLREWGTAATHIFDPGVYHVDFGGALVRMEG